jgi:hypothetical protein
MEHKSLIYYWLLCCVEYCQAIPVKNDNYHQQQEDDMMMMMMMMMCSICRFPSLM